MSEQYLTREQVAERLSCALSTVDKLISRKDGEPLLESERLPGTTCRRISEQALAEYLSPVETGVVVELEERRA